MHAPHIILAQRTRFHPIPKCPEQPLLAGLARLDSILKDLLNWYGSFFNKYETLAGGADKNLDINGMFEIGVTHHGKLVL